MGINYVENQAGVRRIRWIGLISFAILCSLPAAIPYLFFIFAMTSANSAATIGVAMGLIVGVGIFTSSLALSLRMPLDKLPASRAT